MQSLCSALRNPNLTRNRPNVQPPLPRAATQDHTATQQVQQSAASQSWTCATPINAPATFQSTQQPTEPLRGEPTIAVAAPGLPTTYNRLCARRCGNSFREVAELEEVPLKMPDTGQVLIRVTHAGVNGGCETFRVRGEHFFAGNRQLDHYLLGAEGTGIVVAVGSGVSDIQIGDAVSFGGGGAFSEYAIADAQRAFRLPAGVQPSAQVVTLALSGTVANTALQSVAGIQAGETVLVTAAAGGAGHMAAQVALLQAAHVIATCGGPAKAKKLQALGVNRVVDYTTESVDAVLHEEYPQGVDLVYEGVGGAMFATAMQHLAPHGRLLLLGYISQYPHNGSEAAAEAAVSVPGLPPIEELFWGQKDVWRGSQHIFGQVVPRDAGEIRARRQEMFDWWLQGKLQVWVDDSCSFYGLDRVADAMDHMLSGRTVGKVVVQVAEP